MSKRKCEFSETNFEAYHSRQIEKLIAPSEFQYFPTRVEEGMVGYDMRHTTKHANFFFQYKVPYTISPKNPKCSGLIGNCFKMAIYNKRGRASLPQYQLLWDLSKTEPYVYYTVPTFNSEIDFGNFYTDIIQYSAHFNLQDTGFKNPHRRNFSIESHAIYFDDTSLNGYFYSEEKKLIKRSSLLQLNPQFKEVSLVSDLQEKFNLAFDLISQFQLPVRRLIRIKLSQLRELKVEQRRQDFAEQYYWTNYVFRKYFNTSWIIVTPKEEK